MQDRPTMVELLDALESFMRDRSDHARDRWERFQFLVAANSIGILKRETEMEDGHLREEWAGLDELLTPEPVPASAKELRDRLTQRNEELVAAIKRGEFDGDEELPLVRHLYRTIVNNVRIASPREAPTS